MRRLVWFWMSKPSLTAYFKSLLVHTGGQTCKHTVLGKPILINQMHAHAAGLWPGECLS